MVAAWGLAPRGQKEPEQRIARAARDGRPARAIPVEQRRRHSLTHCPDVVRSHTPHFGGGPSPSSGNGRRDAVPFGAVPEIRDDEAGPLLSPYCPDVARIAAPDRPVVREPTGGCGHERPILSIPVREATGTVASDDPDVVGRAPPTRPTPKCRSGSSRASRSCRPSGRRENRGRPSKHHWDRCPKGSPGRCAPPSSGSVAHQPPALHAARPTHIFFEWLDEPSSLPLEDASRTTSAPASALGPEPAFDAVSPPQPNHAKADRPHANAPDRGAR